MTTSSSASNGNATNKNGPTSTGPTTTGPSASHPDAVQQPGTAANMPAGDPAALDDVMATLMSSHRRPADLLRTAARLMAENQSLRNSLEQLRPIHEKLRAEIDTLCESEHYPGVITHVEHNGRLRAEVHVSGMSSVRAEIHPDVDPDEVRVGARVYLAKARNCVLQVLDEPPAWKDVGTFESYLSEGRALLKHMEQPVVVRLADTLEHVNLKRDDRVGFDRDSGLAYEQLPNVDRADLFASEIPSDDFSQIGGLALQIAQIKRAVDFRFRFPKIAEQFYLAEKNGMILDGPPGNGKTRLARSTANYVTGLLPGCPCRFMAINGSEDYSMWLGGSEAALRARFAAVREAAKDGPVVMFFDEIDAIARRRGTDYSGGAPDRILSTLLGLMDDVSRSLKNVILMAATNRADQLDGGLLRPGRLGMKIHVPPPSRTAAEAILRTYLGKPPLAEEPMALIGPLVSELYSPRGPYSTFVTVKLNDGRQQHVPGRDLTSGAMLEAVVQRASEAAAVRTAECERLCPVTAEDLSLELESELHAIGRLLTPQNVKAYVAAIPGDVHPVDVTVRHRPKYARVA